MAKKVLHGPMSCYSDFGDANDRYQRFLATGRPRFKSLLEHLLLFDEVVVPTNDFMPLALMLGVLGEHATILLLETEAIKFARYRGFVTYIGNGGGIALNRIQHRSGRPGWASGDMRDAIAYAVEGVNEIRDRLEIRKLAARVTTELEFSEGEIARLVANEIRTNPVLSDLRGRDLRHFAGIKGTGVVTLAAVLNEEQTGRIPDVLRIAQATIEARAASVTDADDICTSEHVAFLFKGAVERNSATEAHMELRKIENLPDVAELALADRETLLNLLRLRNTPAAQQFRIWFQDNCAADPTRVAQEYAYLLKSVPKSQTPLGRTIRFFAQLAINMGGLALNAVAGLLAGAVAGAIDSFAVDELSNRKSPKIFIEQLDEVGRQGRG